MSKKAEDLSLHSTQRAAERQAHKRCHSEISQQGKHYWRSVPGTVGEMQEKQRLGDFLKKNLKLFHKPYLSGSDETLVSCQIILSPDFSQGPRTAS